MRDEKIFSVKVDCPFCDFYEYHKIKASEIDQEYKKQLCPQCKKPHYVEYTLTSYCPFDG